MSIFHANSLVGASGVAQYEIQRSVRFNSADTASLSRTPSVAGNRKTWTWAGWVKRCKLGTDTWVLRANSSGSDFFLLGFVGYGDQFYLSYTAGVGGAGENYTSAVFRDPSAWYHLVCAFDSTQATAANRIKLYVNGVQQTLAVSNPPTLDADYQVNSTNEHIIGNFSGSYIDFYLADIHFIDGQALDPTSFGEFDTNGVWQPKAYSGTYGTNGFHLPFSNNSTAAALGTDTSGNNNTWTTNNLSVAAGAGNDSLVDTPTNYGTDTGVGGEVRGNYATLNPLAKGGTHALSNGNLDFSLSGTTGSTSTFGTIGVSSGKWYWELTVTGTGVYYPGIGVETNPVPSVQSGSNTTGYAYLITGEKLVNNTLTAYGASFTTGDIVSVALNMDAGTLTCYKNGVSQGQLISGITGTAFPVIIGQLSASGSLNFGQRPFAYAAPTGYKALCTQNLPDPTIADGSTAMDVALWTGDGVNNRQITGLNFSPDLVWIKSRSQAYDALISDAVRGSNLSLTPSSTSSETTNNVNGYVSALSSSGFTLTQGTSSIVSVNGSTTTYVAWTWDAGSSTVTNTDGSITSQVRANPSAGFSIVTYTGNLFTSGNVTVGHGLGVAPALIIGKSRNVTGVDNGPWTVFHSYDFTNYLRLNTTAAAAGIAANGGGTPTAPTSTVFSTYYLSGSNVSGNNYVAYCFAPVAGYSAMGSYVGNGSSDGVFQWCGFRPRWIMWKRSSGAGNDWRIVDTARGTYNLIDTAYLYPNQSYSENTNANDAMDILSNGFKLRTSAEPSNASGSTYVWVAFAESPFQYARAR